MSYKSVTDYMNVDASDLLSLEQQVREMFHDGWQPIGGVAIGLESASNQFGSVGPMRTVYLQTMVQRKNKK
jgi:hypothetical protein